jgi:hypothetical protein
MKGRNVTLKEKVKQQSSEPSGHAELKSYLVFRVGVESGSVSNSAKVEKITNLVTSACELAASDYGDVSLDVSLVSCSSNALPISLVRGKMNA